MEKRWATAAQVGRSSRGSSPIDSALRRRRWLSGPFAPGHHLILLFCSAALLWYLITPPYEAPDEQAHFDFMRFLAAKHRLPDAQPETRHAWEPHQWTQPPVYYVLLAPAVGAIGKNAVPPVPGNPNNLFDEGTSTRRFIWHGERTPGTDALFVARLLSLSFGIVTIFLVYRGAAVVLASRAQAALATAALALVPQFSYLTAALSNDTLVTMLSTAAVVLLIRIWSASGFSFGTAVLLGFCAGAALVTKLNAVFLFPTIAVGVILRGQEQPRRAFRFLLACGAAATFAAGWYFVRNVIVFGDPFAARFKLEIFADVATPLERSLIDDYFYSQLPVDLFHSFWGRFGWLSISAPDEALTLYSIVTGVLAGVICAYLVELIRIHSGDTERRFLAVLTLCLALFIAAKAYLLSLKVDIPGGVLLHHVEVGVIAAAASFVYLILKRRALPVDRREREIALTLTVGAFIILAELVFYNLSWHASQARLMYPALAPGVIVSALAVREAGAKLPRSRMKCWAVPVTLATLGVTWVISFGAVFGGFHTGG